MFGINKNNDGKPEPLNPMIALLLKNLKIDPVEIQAQITNAALATKNTVDDFKARFDALEKKMDVIIKLHEPSNMDIYNKLKL